MTNTNNKEIIMPNATTNATTNDFAATMRATKREIAAGDSKRCSKEGCVSEGVPMKRAAFYADKTQKSGLCVWCKSCEATYNARRELAMRTLGVKRRADLTTPEQHAEWDAIMQPERSRRYRATTAD
jgi:hypothetical protein